MTIPEKHFLELYSDAELSNARVVTKSRAVCSIVGLIACKSHDRQL